MHILATITLLLASSPLPQGEIDYAAIRRATQTIAPAQSPSAAPAPPRADDPAAKIALEVLAARGEFDKWAMGNRQATLSWQFASTIVLFVVVCGITLFGLWMSYRHFRSGAQSATTFKIGKEGVEMTSPFVGLIVLMLSLGFFYLYLANVYPIREIPAAEAENSRGP